MKKLFKAALKKYLLSERTPNISVRKVFFVLSTGRCGTKFISNLLNLSSDTTVYHEPKPGLEYKNPLGYALFLVDKENYNKLEVEDLTLLKMHAELYKTVNTPVFGDCYNSLYPFGFALFKYYSSLGIECKIIHLVRNPVECCSSILRMEGQAGYGEKRVHFQLRANSLYDATANDAEKSAQIWININKNIDYQREQIESIQPNTTCLVRTEDLNDIAYCRKLFDFLEIASPEDEQINKLFSDVSYDVKHSHQNKLDQLGIHNISDKEIEIIRNMTRLDGERYGFN
jgi:hypothetical protein